MPFLKRFLLTLIFIGFIAYIFYFIPPPKSWADATNIQIMLIFVTLLLFFIFLTNLFLNYLLRSFALSIGIVMILLLSSLRQLSYLSILPIILVTVLLFWLIPKKKRLTKNIKIPKLTHVRKR